MVASGDPGSSLFPTCASDWQCSLCHVEKTGPWTLESDRVLWGIFLSNVRIPDRSHPGPVAAMWRTVNLLTKFKTLPSYFILLTYYNSPLYVHSIKKNAKCFGYFSCLIFSSMRSAERALLLYSLHR